MEIKKSLFIQNHEVQKPAPNQKTNAQRNIQSNNFTRESLFHLIQSSILLLVVLVILLFTQQKIDKMFKLTSGLIWSLMTIVLIYYLIIQKLKRSRKQLVAAAV